MILESRLTEDELKPDIINVQDLSITIRYAIVYLLDSTLCFALDANTKTEYSSWTSL